MEENISQNDYLRGEVRILQPQNGYRAGLDAVLLGASANPSKGERVLDVGCGVGTVMLCSHYHYPAAYYVGVEIQHNLTQLAARNIETNKVAEFCAVIKADIRSGAEELMPQSFDWVVTNPPYFKERNSTKSPYSTKALSHIEEVELGEWLRFCLKMLKPRGKFTMIYPMERMDEVLHFLYGKVGEIKIYPLYPKRGQPAKRFILQARKQIQTGLSLYPGLILHKNDGQYTPLAKAILEGEERLIF